MRATRSNAVARHLAELADEGNLTAITAICDALERLDAVVLEHPELRARGDACADWVRQHLD